MLSNKVLTISPELYCAIHLGYYEPYIGYMVLLDCDAEYLGSHDDIFQPIP